VKPMNNIGQISKLKLKGLFGRSLKPINMTKSSTKVTPLFIKHHSLSFKSIYLNFFEDTNEEVVMTICVLAIAYSVLW
jgi:hypothetical protein